MLMEGKDQQNRGIYWAFRPIFTKKFPKTQKKHQPLLVGVYILLKYVIEF